MPRLKRADIVQNEYRDSDGFWIFLRPGFQNGDDPGTHGIVEDTKSAARAKLALVKPCECDECKRLLGIIGSMKVFS
jgi:hypothetical protein